MNYKQIAIWLAVVAGAICAGYAVYDFEAVQGGQAAAVHAVVAIYVIMATVGLYLWWEALYVKQKKRNVQLELVYHIGTMVVGLAASTAVCRWDYLF